MNCDICNKPAMMRCRIHKQHLCGGKYCTQLHRWGGGDCDFITPVYRGDECEFVDPKRSSWVGLLAALTGLSITAAVFAWSHLWKVL